jgi:hypothetical protein
MPKQFKVIDKQGVIHNVRKYLIDGEGEEMVWCDSWYGRHVIGQDCEWYDWTPIKDKQPDVMVEVIGFFPDGDETGATVSPAVFDGEKLVSSFPNSTSYCFEATNWMPYPEPPKTDQ